MAKSTHSNPTSQREPLVLEYIPPDFKRPLCHLYALGASEDAHVVSLKDSLSLVNRSLYSGAPPQWGYPLQALPVSTQDWGPGVGSLFKLRSADTT